MGNFRRDNKFGDKKRGGGGFSGRSDRFGRSDRGSEREMHRAVCDDCGKSCEVPFKPSGDKPVFCSDCFGNKGRSESREPRESRRDFGRFDSGDKQMHQAVCDSCGNDCEVPFKPSSDKPIFCSQCFKKGGSDKSSAPDNKQFEAINAKLDKILKMLNPTVAEKVDVKKVEVKKVDEKKVEIAEKEIAKPKKIVDIKEKKVVAPKKEKAKKKK